MLVSVPFVYVAAGIVLGEVGMFDAIARSWRLVRLRKRLAVVVTLFSVLGQFIVLFGLSAGIDIVARVLIGAGRRRGLPAAAGGADRGSARVRARHPDLPRRGDRRSAGRPRVRRADALHAGPPGWADRPVAGTSLFSPWLTPGMALVAIVALLALVGAVLTLPA